MAIETQTSQSLASPTSFTAICTYHVPGNIRPLSAGVATMSVLPCSSCLECLSLLHSPDEVSSSDLWEALTLQEAWLHHSPPQLCPHTPVGSRAIFCAPETSPLDLNDSTRYLCYKQVLPERLNFFLFLSGTDYKVIVTLYSVPLNIPLNQVSPFLMYDLGN